MRILTLGISHHTADVALRERAGFSPSELATALLAFRDQFPHVEAALLSTCNRTQWTLARPSHAAPDADTLTAWWARQRSLGVEQLTPFVHTSLQRDAVHQLFRVAAGLDARIVGEPEIQHQVKRAYDAAVAARTVGPVLHHVFQNALAAAKAARRETGLSRAGASVASAAIAAMREQFESLRGRTVVCIGAGEIAKATLRRLLRHPVDRVLLINRDATRAGQLVRTMGTAGSKCHVRPWSDIDEALRAADVLITATGATTPVILADALSAARSPNGVSPLLILDLGLPRDVEPGVADLPNVRLVNVDQLTESVAHDPVRAAAIAECERRLDVDATACLTRLRNREVGQLIRQLRHRLHDIAAVEHERSVRKMVALDLPPEEQQAAQRLLAEYGHRLINKVLHLPLTQLDARRDDAAPGFYAAALRRLFDLDESPEPSSDPGLPADTLGP